ncbi:hypothetical protein WN48_07022, partial [Eufriesea mexicana]
IAEDVELMMRHLDALLEEDPSDALVARWRRQRTQIRPVAVIIWINERRRKKILNLDHENEERTKLNLTARITRALENGTADGMITDLEKHAEYCKAIRRLRSFCERVVFALRETHLSSKSLTIDSVLGSSRVAASPMTMVLFQFVDVIHQRTSAQNCERILWQFYSRSSIDQLPGSSRRILPAQRFAAQGLVVGFYSIGFDIHGALPRSRRHWELGHPRAGSWNRGRFYLAPS